MEAMLKFFCGVVGAWEMVAKSRKKTKGRNGQRQRGNSKNIFKGSLWMVSLNGDRGMMQKGKGHVGCRTPHLPEWCTRIIVAVVVRRQGVNGGVEQEIERWTFGATFEKGLFQKILAGTDRII